MMIFVKLSLIKVSLLNYASVLDENHSAQKALKVGNVHLGNEF